LLLACHGQDPALLRTWLPLPRVAVFTGHMVDQPGRAGPRFPPEAMPEVERALATLLADLNVGFGYAAAANGGDLIFLDLVKRRDGETHIVLPYGKERFRRDSVGPGPGCDWAARFDRALEQACEVVVASSQRRRGGAVAYAYTADLLLGMAAVHADQIEAELVTIALWDGKPGDGLGGTASTVERWRALGHAVHIIPLPLGAAEVRPPTGFGAPLSTRVTAADGAEDACGFTEEIKALLFADVVRYSHLTDEQIPIFVTHFLGAVGRLLEQAPVQPVMRNTWGDALYFVFDRIADAGSFALDLRDRLCRVDWAQIGLPPDLNLRIALHAGPVYACTDPITGQAQFTGTHVSRAARIEPVTPPGRIFASKPFAALAAAQRVTAFRCEYVGLIPLAKGYGVFPTYHVRRGHSG
jgi:class 3 adenylate cyclase